MRSFFVRNPTLVSISKSLPLIYHRIGGPKSPESPLGFSLTLSRWWNRRLSTTAKERKVLGSNPTAAAAMGVGSGEEVPSRRFWIKSKRESIFALYTPFIVCMASGTLELDTFRDYIAQDVYFLRAFVQAYEMAEEYADDDDEKAAIYDLKNGVWNETKIHDSLVEELSAGLAKESPPNSATVKFTDFLLATASGKVEGGKGPGKIATPFEKTKLAAYTLGSLTPCMRVYSFLGKELQSLLDPVDTYHPYRNWIENYASERFEKVVLQTEELLDKLSISLTGEELKVMERIYHQAMKLEVEYFSSQPIVQRTVVPLLRVRDPTEGRLVLFSDFDLTCTTVDSSAILAEIAILTASKSGQNGPETLISRKSSADLRNSWDLLSKQYAEEHEQCMESIIPSEKAKIFNYEGLCEALDQLSEFEKRANSRVFESEVLKGLNLEDIKRAGERLILQNGCIDFFQQIVKEELNANVHILSYCWCGDLIRSAFSSGGLNELNIHSNEFVYVESVSTAEIVKKMESPIDKVKAFKDILKTCSEDGKHLSVYIGDSVGDLLCLLEADVGIVVGSSSSLRRVGRQFGVSFIPLSSGLVKKQRELMGDLSKWKGLTGVLYTVSSWAEIHAFILGP